MTKYQCGIGIKMSRFRCYGIAQDEALAVQGRKRLELWSPAEATSSRVLEIAFPNVSRKPGTAAKAPNDAPRGHSSADVTNSKERALT